MHSRTLLILSVLAVVVIWQLPYGKQILYPLTLLATFAHEMGHGLMAMLLGAHFDQLHLNADGSGLAIWQGDPGPAARALIAAGGLLGPSLAGVGLLFAGTSSRARAALSVLAASILIVVAVWVRNPFGILFLLAVAAILAVAARILPAAGAAFLVSFVAVTLCLSWFADLNYMFSAYAEVDGRRHPSDSAAIAQALWLPYWFWGGIVAISSLAVLVLGLRRVSERRA